MFNLKYKNIFNDHLHRRKIITAKEGIKKNEPL